jgi:hypothetical protein
LCVHLRPIIHTPKADFSHGLLLQRMAHFNLRGRKSDVYHALTIVSESEILNDLLYDPKPVQKRRVSIRSTVLMVLIERGVGGYPKNSNDEREFLTRSNTK